VYGTPERFGYKDFIPQFQGERYDPDAWAELLPPPGRFVCPWPSTTTASPCTTAPTPSGQRQEGAAADVVGQLAKAARARDLCSALRRNRRGELLVLTAAAPSRRRAGRALARLYGLALPQAACRRPRSSRSGWCAPANWSTSTAADRLVRLEITSPRSSVSPALRRLLLQPCGGVGLGVAINFKNEAIARDTAVLDIERGQLAGIRRCLAERHLGFERTPGLTSTTTTTRPPTRSWRPHRRRQ